VYKGAKGSIAGHEKTTFRPVKAFSRNALHLQFQIFDGTVPLVLLPDFFVREIQVCLLRDLHRGMAENPGQREPVPAVQNVILGEVVAQLMRMNVHARPGAGIPQRLLI